MFRSYHQLIKSEPRALSYGVVHTFFSGFGQTFFIALFIPELQKFHNMGHTEFGSLYSFATICSALLIPFVGATIDHVHLRKYSLWVNSGLVLGYLLLNQAQSPVALFLALFLIRLCGQALLPHIAATATGRYFKDFRGRALAISGLGHPIGEAILPLLLAFLMIDWGWSGSVLLLLVLNITIFLPSIFYLLPKDASFLLPAKPSQKSDGLVQKSQWEVLKSPFFLSMLPSLMAYPFIGTGIFFHQGAIANLKGWDLHWMIACFPVYAAFRVMGTFFGGACVDRWSASSLAALPLVPLFFSLVVMFQDSPWSIPIYMSGFGVSIGLASCVYMALWAECYGTEELGKIKSATKPFVIGSTALAPIIFGLCLDTEIGLNGLFRSCFGCVGVAFALVYTPWVQRRLLESRTRL